MSLVGTLSKVALGVAAAKGIAHVAGKMTQPTDAHLGGKGTGAGDSAASSNSSLPELVPAAPKQHRHPRGGSML